MIKKTIKCNDITFETINDILKYKKAGNDHSWHITPECINETKKVYTELYNKISELRQKLEDPDNIMKTANEILIGLDKMLEDAKICRDALKMNALMQASDELHTDLDEDMEDEAQEIYDREMKKLVEKNLEEKSELTKDNDEIIIEDQTNS